MFNNKLTLSKKSFENYLNWPLVSFESPFPVLIQNMDHQLPFILIEDCPRSVDAPLMVKNFSHPFIYNIIQQGQTHEVLEKTFFNLEVFETHPNLRSLFQNLIPSTDSFNYAIALSYLSTTWDMSILQDWFLLHIDGLSYPDPFNIHEIIFRTIYPSIPNTLLYTLATTQIPSTISQSDFFPYCISSLTKTFEIIRIAGYQYYHTTPAYIRPRRFTPIPTPVMIFDQPLDLEKFLKNVVEQNQIWAYYILEIGDNGNWSP